MSDWIGSLARHAEMGEACVLITVLRVDGSAPREAGCKMVVAAGSLDGTIGGGNLEHTAITIAHRLLTGTGNMAEIHDFPLGPSLGQCCGGSVSLLFEPIRPPTLTIALFGAGHVGRALVRVLGDLPCRVIWIDPRADEFPEEIPAHVTSFTSALPTHEVALLPAGVHVLIMTHDHALDLDLAEAALKRPDVASVGMIGSLTKRARFLKRLRQRGLDNAAIERFTCPIGIPGIVGKHPTEIAISVAAQLLLRRHASAVQPAEQLA